MSGLVTFDYCGSDLACSAGTLGSVAACSWGSSSGARSAYGFSAGEGIALQFTCPSTSNYRKIGWASSSFPTSGSHSNIYEQLRYALYPLEGGALMVVEYGMGHSSNYVNVGSYTTSDVLKVILHPDGSVTYTKNDVLIHTSTTLMDSAWYPLYAAGSICNGNPSLDSISYVAAPTTSRRLSTGRSTSD